MYAIIVGGGKVGANVSRALLRMGHEVSIVEARHARFTMLETEFEHMARYGDGTELFVLEAAGMGRCDVCIAVTGDDEDNIVIGQVARDHFGVQNVVARVNDPRNQQHFDLLGVAPTVCATESILSLIEHEVPQHSLVHLFSLRRENLDIIEIGVVEGSRADGARLDELPVPSGSLIVSVLRNRVGRVASPETVLAAGDQVVAVTEPGLESEIVAIFVGE